MNRIDIKFKQLKKQGKKAFIAFVTAGDPSLAATSRLVEEFEKNGVDIVELGVPFSDPLADGPVIQAASQRAISRGTTLSRILTMVKALRARTEVPLCLMTYYNPVFKYGVRRFVRDAKKSGVDGLIMPDLPLEEAGEALSYAAQADIRVILFLSPTSSPARVKRVAARARGFIYYVSLTGVTGARRELPADVTCNIRRIQRLTHTPVCAGFGIATAAQVQQVARAADGVIVGSAIVKKIEECSRQRNMPQRVGLFVRSLCRPLTRKET
jgi:tryptophan synthase alpha chain